MRTPLHQFIIEDIILGSLDVIPSQIAQHTQEYQTKVAGSKVPDVFDTAKWKLSDVIRIKQAHDFALVQGPHGLCPNSVSHGYRCKSDALETSAQRFFALAPLIDTNDNDNEDKNKDSGYSSTD